MKFSPDGFKTLRPGSFFRANRTPLEQLLKRVRAATALDLDELKLSLEQETATRKRRKLLVALQVRIASLNQEKEAA